jgi:hypothetical protein
MYSVRCLLPYNAVFGVDLNDVERVKDLPRCVDHVDSIDYPFQNSTCNHHRDHFGAKVISTPTCTALAAIASVRRARARPLQGDRIYLGTSRKWLSLA